MAGYDEVEQPKKPSCCVRFLRNWILWTLVLIAIAGIVLSILFAIKPCDKKTVTTYRMADIDTLLVVDNSGSIDSNEWSKQISGLKAFLTSMSNSFTGEHFRAGVINFAAQVANPDVFPLNQYTAKSLLSNLNPGIRSNSNEIGVSTCTSCGFDRAKTVFEQYSTAGQFRLVLLVTDGGANSPNNALNSAADLKGINATITGILVGSNTLGSEEVYSFSSCTPKDNRQLVTNVDNSCTDYALATDFDDLQHKADALAKNINVPTTSSSQRTCVRAAYFLYLLLLLPLLFYLFAAPIVYYIRRKCCPKKAPVAMAAAAAPTGGAAAGGAVGPDGKWAPVNAGGYLWAMGGRGTALVPVNFGDGGLPPSAPGAELREKDLSELGLVGAVAEVYGGGATQVRLSRYLCCCFWWCLSDKDKEELTQEERGLDINPHDEAYMAMDDNL